MLSFLKDAWTDVNLVEVCFLLICFVTEFNSSIQFALPFSNTGLLEGFLIVQEKRSAKTARFEVWRQYLILLFLFKKLVQILPRNFFPASASIKFGFLFEQLRTF